MRRRRPTLPRTAAAGLALAVVITGCADDPEPAAPAPTATSSPSPTTSPTPPPSPSPTGPLAPLTGEVVGIEDVTRPALIVKIENTAKARPQAGLEDADLVIEEEVEGGITRFLAVFQSEVPVQVGPIRSARLVDAELLPQFNGIFLYSGGRGDVEAALVGTALRLTEGDSGVYRQSGRRAPSNLFADGGPVYDTAASRDDTLGPPVSGFVFDADVPDGARDCADGGCDGSAISIAVSRQANAGWTYDAVLGGYLRDQNGTPQTTVSDTPVIAANVIALEVTTYEGGCCDTNGSPYVVTETTGRGRAVVLRDGQWYEAEWVRPSSSSPFSLEVGGRPLPLAPGATWMHLVARARMPAAP